MKRVCIVARKRLTYNTRVLKQAATLSDAGYSVTIVSLTEEGLPGREETEQYTMHRRGIPRWYFAFASPRRSASVLIQRLRARSTRRVAADSPGGAALSTPFKASRLRVGALDLAFAISVLRIAWKTRVDIIHIHDSYPLLVGYTFGELLDHLAPATRSDMPR